MANKRRLKGAVHSATNILLLNGVVKYQSAPDTEKEAISSLIMEACELQRETISRINHPEPGNIKGSYRALIQNFSEKAEALMEKILGL